MLSILANGWGALLGLERSGPRLYADNQASGFLLMLAGAIAGVSLWLWDYVLDPVNAPKTIWLRLGFLLCSLPSLLALKYSKNRWIALACVIFTFVTASAIFIEITSLLDRGQLFGVAGLMYMVFLPLFVGCGFTILQLAIMFVAVSAAPPMIASVLSIPDFEYALYLITVLPAAALCFFAGSSFVLMQIANARFRDELEREATTDPLTGLRNRRLLQKIIKVRAEQLTDVCVLTVDLDRFKTVNDNYGHAIGDLLLIEIAQRMLAAFEPQHEVFRIGGDEFVIVLAPGTDPDSAYGLAQGFARSLPKEVALNGVTIPLSASIGVAVGQGPSIDIAELLKQADQAMYNAKRSGSGTSLHAA